MGVASGITHERAMREGDGDSGKKLEPMCGALDGPRG